MDKLERMAVEAVAQAWCLPAHENKPTDPELGDDLTRLVFEALRQCEADTIRRCARVIGDYTTVKWNHVAAEEAENVILALLAQELAQ